MANFKTALAKTLKWEGGLVNDPRDAGGLTNKGITLAVYNSVYGDGPEGLIHIKDSQVEHIYRTLYWDKIGGDRINNQSVANLFFDFAVNAGVKRVVKIVQHIVGTKEDGIIGPKTLYAINSKPAFDLFHELKDVRLNYYYHLCEITVPEKDFFLTMTKGSNRNAWALKGWLNRVASYHY